MKVIFLDIDGVLNSDEYVDRVKKSDIQGIERDIDIEKVKLLKRAIDETGAKVVLSSSWRYTKSASYLKELLANYGIRVDSTPYIQDKRGLEIKKWDSTPYIQDKRGLEIKKWLSENQGVEDFLIIDDEIFDSFDEELMKKLVKISNGNGRSLGEGLLPKDVDEIIERLGRKKAKEEIER